MKGYISDGMKYYNMRFRKGQAEFVAIVAIILIVIVVVILSLQQATIKPPPVSGIEQEAKTVKDSINTLIKTGLKEQLKLIYNQGGMLTPKGFTVKFGMFDVPVWQACDQVSVPDVAKEIEAGVGAYLKENLEPEEEFFGKRTIFDFSKMSVDVDIFKDNLRVKVYLPTTLVDYSIPQPYEVTVPTKLYDILEFSENFVNDNAQGRIFETALVSCIPKFPTDPQSKDWLQYFVTLSDCGGRVFKTKQDLLPPMEKAIKLTVTQTLWNEKPLRSIDQNCFTPVNMVGGKTYPDLNVYFEYPSSWNLDQYFSLSPNPINFVAAPPLPFVPICLTTYYVSYYVTYPIIVEVEDSLMNQVFKFAVISNIANNLPGNCSFLEGEMGEEYIDTCVNDAKCHAKVTVKDKEGNPVEGADVTFDICRIGTTDSNGVAEGSIPCALAELHVYKSGYKSYGGPPVPGSELTDVTVELEKLQEEIVLHFNGVSLECHEPSGVGTGQLDCASYTVESSPTPITDLGELTVLSTFSPGMNIYVPECGMDLVFTNEVEGTPGDTSVVEGLCPEKFNVSAFVTRGFEIIMGYLDHKGFELKGTDKDIYIYMPVVTKIEDESGERDIDESISQGETEQLMTVLRNCGIKPVSTSPQTPNCI